MAMSNPALLSNATRIRPNYYRTHSRSPSRSPVRKTQFAAQHLDPLLSNLSPDSTLKALQATETIPAGPEEDALTESIADASPAEREIGIRAAFAAQKIREWHREISQWLWPAVQQRRFGVGFLPPEGIELNSEHEERQLYFGCLPSALVRQYETRIEEIKSALESLDIEDIKNHVLEAHTPTAEISSPAGSPRKRGGPRRSYGRMRDFTALITATIIQALPELANLSVLLDSWDVRLNVLRMLPKTLDTLEATKAGLLIATTTIRDPKQAALVMRHDFETTRSILGESISDLGRRIDKLLDLLEGHEDALPQPWIDNLESMELEYATWVVDTQKLVSKNEEVAASNSFIHQRDDAGSDTFSADAGISNSPVSQHVNTYNRDRYTTPIDTNQKLRHDSFSTHSTANDFNVPESPSEVKPLLKINTPQRSSHKKNISEISAAESMLSTLSGFSNAEIVDATSTAVVASPKVSVVDSPSRTNRDSLMRVGEDESPKKTSVRPPIIQRASATSIEVVPASNLKKVLLKRNASNELVALPTEGLDSIPREAFRQLSGETKGEESFASASDHTPVATPTYMASQDLIPDVASISDISASLPASPDSSSPALPRKSSKRLSISSSTLLSAATTVHREESGSSDDNTLPTQSPTRPKASPRKAAARSRQPLESLEAKIQDILIALPTRIRMTHDNDSAESPQGSSNSSSRASTPMHSLTLSPVKARGKSGISDTDVRLFHLTQHGQSRDTPPVKLFVRAVGENGERVMVRVGGGWADLGEYLKEYSLHHGRRGVGDGHLELAQYPGKSQRDSAGTQIPIQSVNMSGVNSGSSKRKSKSLSGTLPVITDSYSRDEDLQHKNLNTHALSPNPDQYSPSYNGDWTPPAIPTPSTPYGTISPQTTTSIYSNGQSDTEPVGYGNSIPNGILKLPSHDATFHPNSSFNARKGAPTLTNAATFSPAPSSQVKYTPLGAAGPKNPSRRSVTFGGVSTEPNGAWVQSVIGKPRAVSSNVTQRSTNSTTTSSTMTSTMTKSIPINNRAPARVSTSPVRSNQPGSSLASSSTKSSSTRSRNRLSLGDVSSIKRVFLRRKSEKV